MPRIAIIGAGAAGCFSAIALKRRLPEAEVFLLEAGPRPMAKLALTGGGRCNLTNTFETVRDLKEVYPRGHRLMKGALRQFGPEDTLRWFEAEGVPLKTEAGGRVFPVSDDAMQVVRTLQRLMDRLDIPIRCHTRLTAIRPCETGYGLDCADGQAFKADAVIVTTGGSPKPSGLAFLEALALEREESVPSLFTFKTGETGLRALTGTVAPEASLSIPGTGFRASGPLLLTDWGFSGPATLKLSSYAARHLAACRYQATIAINWLGTNEQEARRLLADTARLNPRKMAANTPLGALPARLWSFLLQRSGLRPDLRWAELGSKGSNRLISTLTNDAYAITGRAAFKEEFVTCGGVSLSNLDPGTLEAKAHPGLFFAGEVMDVDAVTGGFNLQAAWTTGWICARSVALFLKNPLYL